MRIGLIRHFPVNQKFPTGWKTAADLHTWRENYDVAAISVGEFDLGGVEWQSCIASDLPRARETAKAVYRGEVEHTPLLREAQFAPFQTASLRLPVWMWHWMLRLTWTTGHRSQRTCRDDFRQRVQTMADRLSKLDQDTLVVSHAGMMAFLSKELSRRGFTGPKLRIANHATAYVYKK